MSILTGTGPGVYQGYGESCLTEADAALSGIRDSGSVTDIHVPYSGTPREAAQKAIDNNDAETLAYLQKNYRF